MSEEDRRDAEDGWQDASLTAVYQFAVALKNLHDSNPWPDRPLLAWAMNDLMTELWDHGFSQREIREAFEDAVADMPRYTAGQELRP